MSKKKINHITEIILNAAGIVFLLLTVLASTGAIH